MELYNFFFEFVSINYYFEISNDADEMANHCIIIDK